MTNYECEDGDFIPSGDWALSDREIEYDEHGVEIPHLDAELGFGEIDPDDVDEAATAAYERFLTETVDE